MLRGTSERAGRVVRSSFPAVGVVRPATGDVQSVGDTPRHSNRAVRPVPDGVFPGSCSPRRGDDGGRVDLSVEVGGSLRTGRGFSGVETRKVWGMGWFRGSGLRRRDTSGPSGKCGRGTTEGGTGVVGTSGRR